MSTGISVGQRVTTVHDPEQQGLVKYVGRTEYAEGDWVGVVLDSQTGKNDGSVHGVRYFECEPGYGKFYKPNAVRVRGQALKPPSIGGKGYGCGWDAAERPPSPVGAINAKVKKRASPPPRFRAGSIMQQVQADEWDDDILVGHDGGLKGGLKDPTKCTNKSMSNGEQTIESLIRGLVVQLVPDKIDDPIALLVHLLERLAQEIKSLTTSTIGGWEPNLVKPNQTESVAMYEGESLMHKEDQGETALPWLHKELTVFDLTGEVVCTTTVHHDETLPDLMKAVEEAAGIPLMEQSLTMNSGATSTVLIDMLEPLSCLLAPLDDVEISSLVLLRREAHHAECMEIALRSDAYYKVAQLPADMKADPALALAAIQNMGLTRSALQQLCRSPCHGRAMCRQKRWAVRAIKDEKNADVEDSDTDSVSSACSFSGGSSGEPDGGAKDNATEDIWGFPPELVQHREFMLGALKCANAKDTRFNSHKFLMDIAPVDIKKDREILLIALQNSDLQHPADISEILGLKEDPMLLDMDVEFALQLVAVGGEGTVAALPEKLRTDHEVLWAAVRKNGLALRHIPWESVPGHEIALEAVRRTPKVFQHLPEDLRANRDVAYAAVKQDWRLLRLVADSLQGDRDFVLAAAKQNPEAITSVPLGNDTKRDSQIWHAVAKRYGMVLWSKPDKDAPEILFATANRRAETEYQKLVHRVLGRNDVVQPLHLVHVDMSSPLASAPKGTPHTDRVGRRHKIPDWLLKQDNVNKQKNRYPRSQGRNSSQTSSSSTSSDLPEIGRGRGHLPPRQSSDLPEIGPGRGHSPPRQRYGRYQGKG